jgi:dTDP-4-dehydrorhamnose 3,5-epimerase
VRFTALSLPGAFAIAIDRLEDERGFFARTWCALEADARGLCTHFPQCSVSATTRRGTIRGLHYQAPPFGEIKLISCTQGRIFDVLVDLRPDSPTFRRWHGEPLDASQHRTLYVPEGVAHGFQTLTDDAVVYYQISVPFHPESSRGIRWDDPAIGVPWPLPVTCISSRDQSFDRLTP